RSRTRTARWLTVPTRPRASRVSPSSDARCRSMVPGSERALAQERDLEPAWERDSVRVWDLEPGSVWVWVWALEPEPEWVQVQVQVQVQDLEPGSARVQELVPGSASASMTRAHGRNSSASADRTTLHSCSKTSPSAIRWRPPPLATNAYRPTHRRWRQTVQGRCRW